MCRLKDSAKAKRHMPDAAVRGRGNPQGLSETLPRLEAELESHLPELEVISSEFGTAMGPAARYLQHIKNDHSDSVFQKLRI